jgi:hypothetical protein
MRRFLAVAATTALVCAAWVSPAHADMHQSRVVSPDPVNWTPNVLDGTVNAIAAVGDAIVVGGDFQRIEEANGRDAVRRPYLFAFDRGSGRLLNFWPDLDGPVNALAAGPDNTVYVGGSFRGVNNQRHRGVVRLNLGNGEVSDGFTGSVDDGDIRTLVARGNALYVGGSFSSVQGLRQAALARLNAVSGEVDQGFQIEISAPRHPRTKVEDTALSPDGSRLVIIGEITHVAGELRPQLAVLNVGGRRPRLNPWFTLAYDIPCHESYDTYVRAVDFAPGGGWIAVVTTGAVPGRQQMCDTAARFDLRGGGQHGATWVNHTGGDSLSAVSVTGAAVYVGGHQRWMNNPDGRNYAGPGAVPRQGIAALDPNNGAALPWNPTRARGKGVRAMLATPYGLYVGSDTDRLGNEYHGRLGMFPL